MSFQRHQLGCFSQDCRDTMILQGLPIGPLFSFEGVWNGTAFLSTTFLFFFFLSTTFLDNQNLQPYMCQVSCCLPESTLCRNPLQESTHSRDSSGESVLQTSWCYTGKKLWSGQNESPLIPCPELPYIWNLKGKKRSQMSSKQRRPEMHISFYNLAI